jgi:hypothetical protein
LLPVKCALFSRPTPRRLNDLPAPVPDRVVQGASPAIDAPGASMSAPASISALATSTSSLLAAQYSAVSA